MGKYITTDVEKIQYVQNQDGSVTYYGTYYVKGKGSKRIKLGVKGVDLKDPYEARVRLTELLSKPQEERSTKIISLNYLADKYFEERLFEVENNYYETFGNVKDSNLKEKLQNVNTEKNRYKNHISEHDNASIDLNEFGGNEAQEIIKFIRNKKLSGKTKFLIMALVRTIWNYGLNKEIIRIASPFTSEKVSLIKNPKKTRTRYLSHIELKRLLTELEKPKYEKNAWVAAYLGILTGARARSVLNIKKQDVIWNQEENKYYIRIYNLKAKSHNIYYVPITDSSYSELKKFMFSLHSCNDYLIQPIREGFARPNQPLRKVPQHYFDACNLIFNQGVNVKDNFERNEYQVNFHTLRHSVAFIMANSGVPLNYVKEVLNHSTIEITMNYVKAKPSHLHDAVSSVMSKELLDYQHERSTGEKRSWENERDFERILESSYSEDSIFGED